MLEEDQLSDAQNLVNLDPPFHVYEENRARRWLQVMNCAWKSFKILSRSWNNQKLLEYFGVFLAKKVNRARMGNERMCIFL
jgi:hypothetical protein